MLWCVYTYKYQDHASNGFSYDAVWKAGFEELGFFFLNDGFEPWCRGNLGENSTNSQENMDYRITEKKSKQSSHLRHKLFILDILCKDLTFLRSQ